MAKKTNTPAVSEYEQQAIDFLTKHNATVEVTFSHKGTHPNWNDKQVRNIYKFTIKRNGKQTSGDFYDSVNNTEKDNGVNPGAYDILSCITKHDPGSFEEFCREFGYDEDSRSGEKTYHACMYA